MTIETTATELTSKTDTAEAPTLHLVTEEGLSERWNGSPTASTLRKWRSEKKGPPFLKIGSLIRYDVRRADEWLLQHLQVPDAA